jgi:hypothetical protein
MPIVIYTGYVSLTPEKLARCIPSEGMIKAPSVFPSLSVALSSISTILSSSVYVYLCLPPPIGSVHFSIEAFRWSIAVKAILRGANEMLGVGWMPPEPSHAFDDVSTPVFDWTLVFVIPSHILEGV